MGDRWKDGDYWDGGHLGVKKSTYVWLPITFTPNNNGTEDMTIEWVDEFTIEPKPVAEDPSIVIGNITVSDGKTVVDVSIENPTDETDEGVLAVAAYNKDGVCLGLELAAEGKAELSVSEAAYVKAYLWSGLTGENAMKPLTPSVQKSVE